MKKVICLLNQAVLMLALVLILSPAAQANNGRVKMSPSLSMSADIVLQEDNFRPTSSEKAFFAKAKTALPGSNGFFTNPQGVSAYLITDDVPLNFCWTGTNKEATVFDGSTRSLINGIGEMTVKYADDDLILQRYKGEVKNGLWHGHGELLAREAYHYNAFYYNGDFVHGRMEGKGSYINNDLLDRGGVPFLYEGEFMDDTFHGQGVMTDLATGEIIHAGLWLEGFPFEGTPAQWKRENKKVEILYAQRRYNDPRIMSQIELANGKSDKASQAAALKSKEEITSLEMAKSAGANTK